MTSSYSYSSHHNDTVALYDGTIPFRLRKITELVYGTAEANHDIWIKNFNAHNKRVREIIPEKQLLVMDITRGDGWNKLCPFLEVTTGPCLHPEEPFPRENDKNSRENGLTARKNRLGIQWTPESQPVHTRFAYASLLAYPSSAEHRDYFVSFLVAVESIRETGSKQDVVALVYGQLSTEEERILQNEKIKYIRVGPVGANLPQNYEAFDQKSAAIYRAKLRVLQLIDYEAVLFFDSDVIFHKNCDHLFENKHQFVGRYGNNSPFNAGVFLVRPSWQAFVDLIDVSSSKGFSLERGWLNYGPIPDWREGSRGELTDWSFYGSTVEQGLFYYYYFCFIKDGSGELLPSTAWGDLVTHFTGFNKPFLSGSTPKKNMPERYRRASHQWHLTLSRVDSRVTDQLMDQAEQHAVNVVPALESEPSGNLDASGM